MATTITTGVEHALCAPISSEEFSKQLPVTITFMAVEYAGASRGPTQVEVTVDIRVPVDMEDPHRVWKISGTTSDGRKVAGVVYLDDPEKSSLNIMSTEVLPRQRP